MKTQMLKYKIGYLFCVSSLGELMVKNLEFTSKRREYKRNYYLGTLKRQAASKFFCKLNKP